MAQFGLNLQEAEAMQKDSKIWVAGHKGLVGSAIISRLQQGGHTNLIIPAERIELTDFAAVDAFFTQAQPQFVFLAAAKVGGILANNTYPADFITINLAIQNNIIVCCHKHKVQKLLFLGSSCIYPKFAPQPMKEEHLLSGKLESTNDAYAIAKIAGIIMCKSYNRQHGTNFIAAMPTNLYGPGDNFNLKGSHVLPAMIRKFHEGKLSNAPTIELWGTGSPMREFLYNEDLADGCVYLMNHFNATNAIEDEKMFVNIGTGEDIQLKDLAALVQDVVGYKGQIVWNVAMPDGTPRKLLDVSRLTSLGWTAKTKLPEGVRSAYQWFLDNQESFRG